MKKIAKKVDGSKLKFWVNNVCPICHKETNPKLINTYRLQDNEIFGKCLIATFQCVICNLVFNVLYEDIKPHAFWSDSTFSYQEVLMGVDSEYSPFVPDIPPLPQQFQTDNFKKFREAYDSAYLAEHYNINGLIEMAYRRCCEFLIRDYLIFTNPNSAENYNDAPISQLIRKLENEKIRELSTKIQWIGNDYTHYNNHHKDTNYQDMKEFFEILLREVRDELILQKSRVISRK